MMSDFDSWDAPDSSDGWGTDFPTPAKRKKRRKKKKRGSVLPVLIAAALVLVIVLVIWLLSSGSDDPLPTETTATTAATEPAQTEATVSSGACATCGNRGRITCLICKGRGYEVVVTTKDPNASGAYQRDCQACGTSGETRCPECYPEDFCGDCKGTGDGACQRCKGSGIENRLVLDEHELPVRDEDGNLLRQEQTCTVCGGDGIHTCRTCDGIGTVKTYTPCDQCQGEGRSTCDECDGHGTSYITSRNDSSKKEKQVCRKCLGSGIFPCPYCHGSGSVESNS